MRVVWHSLAFLKARIAAPRGAAAAALTLLDRAVARGSRRGWWLAIDPALAVLRKGTPQTAAALIGLQARIEADVRAQHERVPSAPR